MSQSRAIENRETLIVDARQSDWIGMRQTATVAARPWPMMDVEIQFHLVKPGRGSRHCALACMQPCSSTPHANGSPNILRLTTFTCHLGIAEEYYHILGALSQLRLAVGCLIMNAPTPCSRLRTALHNQNMLNSRFGSKTKEKPAVGRTATKREGIFSMSPLVLELPPRFSFRRLRD